MPQIAHPEYIASSILALSNSPFSTYLYLFCFFKEKREQAKLIKGLRSSQLSPHHPNQMPQAARP